MTTAKIDICHFISGDLWAGAEVMACNLITALQSTTQVRQTVLILNRGTLADKLADLDIDVVLCEEAALSLPGLVRAARAFTVASRPDIIHAHRYKENILAWLATDFGRRARLLATQHGLPETGTNKRVVAGVNRWLLRKQFGTVVGVSANILDYFQTDCRIPLERTAVVHNGIFLPAEPASHARQQPLRVGSAGRLFPVKDYPLLVDVAHCVASKAPTIRFTLAGEGPERSALEKQIRSHALESTFSLCGHQQEMQPFYENIDVYINTSVHEGIPMSILEAMAYGLPVVAPKVGGIAEIIDDGVDGFLIEERCPEAFSRPLLALQDLALRRRMGLAARAKIRNAFSAQSMAEQYLHLYRQLVN